MKNFVVRGVFGALIAVVALSPTAGVAAADVPQQASPVYCQWGGDGLFAERDCDKNGPNSGSASGSGTAVGQFLGKLLFGGGR